MKKRVYAISSILAVVLILPPWLLGFSVFHLGHAVQVATSLSAKLACSARYISGFSPDQISRDLATYSPATELVNLQYFENPKKVTAHLFDLATVTAEYREGMGCSLRADNDQALPTVTRQKNSISPDQDWPLGQNVNSINSEVQRLTDTILNKDNDQGLQTRALVVVKNGRIVAESYADGITNKTPLLGWSMAKSITAMMLGSMEQLGRLNHNQNKLFHQWHNDQRAEIQLKHLLTMTSGLKFDETYAPGSDATHMLFTAQSASDVALDSDLKENIGTHFSYSSGTTNILTRLLHKKLGNDPQADQRFLSQNILHPAGITTASFETDTSGVIVGSSYLYASARDWARFALIMLQQGEINNTRILSADWVTAATTPNGSENEKAYGYQFWLNQGDKQLRWPELPSDAYAMMGNRKQSVMIIPSEQLILVRLGWTSGDYPMAQHYKKLIDRFQTK